MRKVVCVFLAAIFAVGAYGAGPLSPYYLTFDIRERIDVVQGLNIINSWPMWNYHNNNYHNVEFAIAVDTTVRTLGEHGAGTWGAEYTLGGIFTGNLYLNNYGHFLDSTTDGQHNYLIDKNSGNVLQTDSSYQNPQVLFNASGFAFITWDPTNNSLWIANWGGQVENRTLSGTLLSSFNTGISTGQTALALDHADGTLWLSEWGNQGWFRQYDKSGNLLQQVYIAGAEFPLGGEFQLPEPGTLGLLGLAGLLLLRRR